MSVGGSAAQGIESGFNIGQRMDDAKQRRYEFEREQAARDEAQARLKKQEDDRYGRLADATRVQAVQAQLDAVQKDIDGYTKKGDHPPDELLHKKIRLAIQHEDMQAEIAQGGRLSAGSALTAPAPRPNVASAEPPASASPLQGADASLGPQGAPAPAQPPAPAGALQGAGAMLGPRHGPAGLAPPMDSPDAGPPAVPGGAPPVAAVSSPVTSARTPAQQLVADTAQRSQDLSSRLATGQTSLDQVDPGDFALMVASATKHDPSDLAPVRQGVNDWQAGMQTGNNGLVLQGVNKVFGPQIAQGVGSPSGYGGTITGKSVIGLDPALSGDGKMHTDKVIPRLRVTTDVAGPDGQLMHYDAPMTVNRSTDPGDPPQAIAMGDAFNHVGALSSLMTTLDHPDAQALLAKGVKDKRVAELMAAYRESSAPVNAAQVSENQIQSTMKAFPNMTRDDVVERMYQTGQLKRPPLTRGAMSDIDAAQALVDSGEAPDLTSALGILQRTGVTKQRTKYSQGAIGAAAAGGGAGVSGGAGIVAPTVAGKFMAGSSVVPAPDRNGMVLGVTPQALENDATYFAMTTKMPENMSRSKENIPYQKLVKNRAAELLDRAGLSSTDFVTGGVDFKATARSLLQQQSKVDAITANLNSLHNNIRTFDEIALGKVPSIGGERVAAMANDLKSLDFSTLRDWNELKIKIGQHFNDPTMTAYATAAMAVAMDVARIQVGGSQSVAQTAEGARREAIKLVAAGVDNKARAALLGAIESDSQGQVKGLTDQLSATRSRMGHGLGGPPAPAAPKGGAPVQIKNAADFAALPSDTEFIDPNGVHRRKP